MSFIIVTRDWEGDGYFPEVGMNHRFHTNKYKTLKGFVEIWNS